MSPPSYGLGTNSKLPQQDFYSKYAYFFFFFFFVEVRKIWKSETQGMFWCINK